MTEQNDAQTEQMMNEFMDGLDIPKDNPSPEPTPNPTPEPEPSPEPTPEPNPEPSPEPEPTPEPDAISDDIKLRAFNEMFGTSFTSLEDVGYVKNTLTEVESLREIQKKYKEIEETPIAKFHNDKLRELNTFAETTGIDSPTVFEKIKHFDATDKKDPIEALVLAEILKDPSLASRTDLLRKSIAKEYKTSIPNEEDLDGNELQEARDNAELETFRLERNAAKAQKEISDVLDKVKAGTPNETIRDIQAKREVIRDSWDKYLSDKHEMLFAKIPVQVPKGKDANGNDILETIDNITLSKEEQKEVALAIVKEASSKGLELNQENFVKLIPKHYDRILARNIAKVTNSISSKKEAQIRLELEKKYSNPSNLKIETKVPAGNDKPKTADDILDPIYKAQGFI